METDQRPGYVIMKLLQQYLMNIYELHLHEEKLNTH